MPSGPKKKEISLPEKIAGIMVQTVQFLFFPAYGPLTIRSRFFKILIATVVILIALVVATRMLLGPDAPAHAPSANRLAEAAETFRTL